MIKLDEDQLTNMRQFGAEHYSVDIGPELKALLEAGYTQTREAMNRNLYGSMWDRKPTKPKSWLSKQITTVRHALADRLTSFASFVGGYDVRGDW